MDYAETIREQLPGWTGLKDMTGVQRFASFCPNGAMPNEDIPLAINFGAWITLYGTSPAGRAHSVSRDTLEGCIAHMLAMQAEETPATATEAVNEEPVQASDEDSVGDHGGDGPARLDLGELSGADEGGTAHPAGAAPALDHIPERLEEIDAEIVEPSPAPLDADSVDVQPVDGSPSIIEGHKPAEPPAYGGTLVEKDEIARLIKELAVAIVYRREDLTASISRTMGDLEEERVGLYNLPERNDEQVARLSAIQSELAALIQRKAAIERYATNAREGLEGKSLAYLRQVDVAALPWPT